MSVWRHSCLEELGVVTLDGGWESCPHCGAIDPVKGRVPKKASASQSPILGTPSATANLKTFSELEALVRSRLDTDCKTAGEREAYLVGMIVGFMRAMPHLAEHYGRAA